ncbi:hypothetical protein BLA28_23820 [Eisenbergiella tayi]|nr:hypothetical protein BLA28_23820 [Eisenbergiella tayi]
MPRWQNSGETGHLETPRFFPWIGTHIHSRRRTERAGEPRAGGTKEGRPQKGRYDGSGKGGEGR